MAPPQVNDEYRKQIEGARKELGELISKNKHNAPLMLHLALHDAGIYDFQTATEHYLIKRGPNGSIRNKKELGHPYNKGLEEAVKVCDPAKEKYNKITYADLYQLAGVVAVEKTGGPKIEFVPGREDSTQDPEEGRLPDEKKELDVFQLEKITKRMGLEEKDMVALLGGLRQWKLPVESPTPQAGEGQGGATPQAGEGQGGTAPKAEKGKEGTPKEELKFDNSYFRNLLDRNPNLLLSKWVGTYAKDLNAFLRDYGAAHKKVSELGMSRAKAAEGTDQKASASRNRVRLVQGFGIAVVTTAIILGFFLSRRSK